MATPACDTRKNRFRINPIAATIVWASCGGIVMSNVSHAATEPEPEAMLLPTLSISGSEANQVSSPKATAPLVDTPQTISVIPRQVFNQQGAQNLTDVLKNTPGISFNAGENGFSTTSNNFSLRGFDTSGHIFIDGARDSGSYSRDVFNLEQVEVAKGPAADNGRGGAGGYVNLVTKTPRLENAYSGSLSHGFDRYDSDPRQRATLDVNHVLTDSVAVRLNVMGQAGGIAGRDEAEQEAWGIAPSLAFGLGTATRLTLSYQHIEQNDRPDWGVPAALIKDMMRYDPIAKSADRDSFYGLDSDYDDTESDSLLLRIEHDLSSNLRISNQTRWAQTERKSRFTVPFSYDPASFDVTTQTQFYDRETESLSNLTNLSAAFRTGKLEHNLAAGLELSREKSDAYRYGTVSPPNTNVFHPDSGRAGPSSLAPTETNSVDIDTYALYVYNTVKLNPYWEITGGLRGERYKVSIDSRTIGGASSGPDGYERTENSISGKLGVVMKPASNGSIYAAVGWATLPPGSFLSNPDISRTGNNAFPGLVGQNNDEAKEQKSLNYEIGTKWDLFDERLATSLAVFRTERQDVAITGKTPGDPGSATELKGYGEQIVQGVELSVSGRINPAWSVFGGLAYMDTERKHSAYLDAARREANPGDYGAYPSTRGDRLAFTPRLAGTLWTTYDFAMGLTVGGGVQYVGSSYAGRPDDADRIIPNGQFGKLPDYTVFNLMAAYTVNPNLTLRLNIDNVTDELYATSANWPAQRVELGPPRSYLLSADVKF